MIDLKGHIVGVALSPDNRYLYANVRRWPTNSTPNLFESPPIASEIEMRVVDLKSLELIEDVVFTGHRFERRRRNNCRLHCIFKVNILMEVMVLNQIKRKKYCCKSKLDLP